MRWADGGYTVVEVMVFLMISAVIFFSAVTVFHGQQGKTGFEQGLRDSVSKFQQYVDEVTTSVFSSGQYNCAVSNSSGRATLSKPSGGANGAGSNQGCIFLGRAIQVIPGQTSIYAYSVLGNQYTASGEPATSYAGTLPEPALASGVDLTEQYDTPWGKVTSSKITYSAGGTADSSLVSFYNSLQDGYQNSGVAGAQSITARGYNFTSSSLTSVRSDALKSCLEEQNANGLNCLNTPTISQWDICFSSTGSSQTALLSVFSNPSGITTNVNFTSCT